MNSPPARKTILFHIGPPKTGTTSIQGALVRHSRALEARGVWFPYDRDVFGDRFPSKSAPNIAPQTEAVAYFADQKNRPTPSRVDWHVTLEAFLNDGSAHTLIVSHESLSQQGLRLRSDVLNALRDHADVKFLSYIRHPLSYLSAYIRQGFRGPGPVAPRHQMNQITRYMRAGFSGLLAPFDDFGHVDIASYDKLNIQNQLIEDLFGRFGGADLINAEPPTGRRNISRASLGLSCVFIALKLQGGWVRPDWISLRDTLEKADMGLDIPLTPSFLQADLAANIQDRWLTDRAVLEQRYGTALPRDTQLALGPDKLILTRDYGDALWQAAQPKLSGAQKERLRLALDMVGRDLEADLAALPTPMQPIGL
ncbi:MAG: hypothetical protein ACI91Z_000016 [Yoonia sp.]|jgi:hypothetical protein